MDATTRPSGVERRPSGANQAASADHNERLVMTLLRQGGPMPGAEIARSSGLTAQAVSVILRRLTEAGLVRRGDALRGRVGKPRVPVGIDPGGAVGMGLKVGRRSVELVVVDLAGKIVAREAEVWLGPDPAALGRFVRRAVPALLGRCGGTLPCGIGVAMPHEIWAWDSVVPPAPRAAWEAMDLPGLLTALSGVPVAVRNDMTSAARAELAWGPARAERDWAYIHIGALAGGGVVLDGQVRDGRRGNAGAFGPLRLVGPDGEAGHLYDQASLLHLERALGRDLAGYGWDADDAVLRSWLDTAAVSLGRAAAALCAVLDFEAIVIDGLFPPRVRADLVVGARRELAAQDQRGLMMPDVQAGSIGADARVLGAATVALEQAYFLT